MTYHLKISWNYWRTSTLTSIPCTDSGSTRRALNSVTVGIEILSAILSRYVAWVQFKLSRVAWTRLKIPRTPKPLHPVKTTDSICRQSERFAPLYSTLPYSIEPLHKDEFSQRKRFLEGNRFDVTPSPYHPSPMSPWQILIRSGKHTSILPWTGSLHSWLAPIWKATFLVWTHAPGLRSIAFPFNPFLDRSILDCAQPITCLQVCPKFDVNTSCLGRTNWPDSEERSAWGVRFPSQAPESQGQRGFLKNIYWKIEDIWLFSPKITY